MSKVNPKYYPSKLLLFGEYTVTKGSDALAVPFHKFKGSWKYNEKVDNSNLLSFAEFLNRINWSELAVSYNFDEFHNDLLNGLYFDSSIKSGYGIGSSGALSAAVFDTYFSIESENIDYKNVLSQIENYFHGSSSGIDPMVSYLNKAIRLNSETGYEIIENNSHFTQFDFYLLDSNITRSTKHFVEIFNNFFEKETFQDKYFNPLFNLNNRIIDHFTQKNEVEVFRLFKKISKIQYNAFGEMILPELTSLWHEIFTKENLSIKLCGAGGGGYYLIMTDKTNDNLDLFEDFDLIKITL